MKTSVYIIEPIRTREIDEEKDWNDGTKCSLVDVFSRFSNVCTIYDAVIGF